MLGAPHCRQLLGSYLAFLPSRKNIAAIQGAGESAAFDGKRRNRLAALTGNSTSAVDQRAIKPRKYQSFLNTRRAKS